MGRTRYERQPNDQVRESRKPRGYQRKDAKGALETRLASMDAAEEKRTSPHDDATDAPEAVTGKLGRAPAQGAMDSDIPEQIQEKGCRKGNLHLAYTADK